jgi:lysyl-tRNA synthetase class 2
LTRAWFRALVFFSRWWQIASLYRANAKFRPSREPRFICFGSSRNLASIAYAAMHTEGFLTLAKRNLLIRNRRPTADERGGQ